MRDGCAEFWGSAKNHRTHGGVGGFCVSSFLSPNLKHNFVAHPLCRILTHFESFFSLDPAIVCWLTLRLRQVGHQQPNEKGLISVPRGTGTATIPEILFASGRFLGNIGAPLRNNGGDDKELDELAEGVDPDSSSGYILGASRPPTRLSRLGFEELRPSPELGYL